MEPNCLGFLHFVPNPVRKLALRELLKPHTKALVLGTLAALATPSPTFWIRSR